MSDTVCTVLLKKKCVNIACIESSVQPKLEDLPAGGADAGSGTGSDAVITSGCAADYCLVRTVGFFSSHRSITLYYIVSGNVPK